MAGRPPGERRRVGAVAVVIAAGVLARLVLAGSIGLGVDESYAVAVSRPLSLSYYDHPPLAFWIAGLSARLFGTGHDVLLRLPFIILFAGTTWLMYRLAALAFGERAGLITALLVTIIPVFGVADGGWILPDGPLLFGFAATTLCLMHAVSAGRDSWRWWLLAGAGAGIASLSKYHAIFLIIGTLVFLATSPRHRHWLRRPEPYAAGAIALVMALPVIVWNANRGWASFRFQSGRADLEHGLHVSSLIQNLAGQAGYMLPWIWGALVWLLIVAARRGPRDTRRWLLVCLGSGPVLLFTLLSLGGRPGLPHWPAPGFLLLVPLLGEALARVWESGRRGVVTAYLAGSAAIVVVAAGVAAAQVRTGWMSDRFPQLFARGDPSLDAVDWRAARLALSGNEPIVAANWRDAGKLGAALASNRLVLTAGDDPRQFAFVADQNALSNGRLLAVVRSVEDRQRLEAEYPRMDSVGTIPIRRRGRVALTLVEYEAGGRRRAVSVPFAVGEQLEYGVSFGAVHVGSGKMQVIGTDTVDGHATWHAELAISGGIPMFHVRDTTMSWFDVGDFDSRRFVQHIHEGRYRASRDFRIDPSRRQYVENDKPAAASTADPLDDVSLLYYVRTLPLVDGDRYELARYFQPAGNPVVIRVIRREEIVVPAGRYRAVLVEPEIATAGIFSHKGRAQLWFSDDSARVLLQMKSRLSFGSINLYLTKQAR